ncbi:MULTISPECIES: DUF805 domain-containing protein [unclassified Streptomyces]|uniref:DUF805 domain-containing protein n=1 Tax=unclassified Streptomyces TaxID=2593676 RepID=UPI0016619782|nr:MULTISPECIES: DUF805 domain-containing protein [unclassified Streptomyces]MBD0842867.1 DUF805 domain-containing protein [Streptomyces sp. TRM68416]
MNWFVEVVKKYAVFSGRARRKEYWMYTLFYMIFAVVASIVDLAVLGSQILSLVMALGLLLPSLGVTVRRLHDTGRSGWWILIALIPLVGGIVLLVFLCLDGEAGANKHGENPKFVQAHA